MYAIATLLDPATDQEIRAVWRRFEDNCGLTGIRRVNLPHFSWTVADSYHFSAVEGVLQEVAGEMTPLLVRSAGLGIFTGPRPVVYAALVKDANLLHWHTVLWEKTRPYAVVPNDYYHPSRWVPHITLAYHEVDAQQLGCAMQEMVYTPMDLAFTVQNLSLIYHTDGHDGIHNQYDLRKEHLNG